MVNRDNPYFQQVALIIDLLPLIGEETCFALSLPITQSGASIQKLARAMWRLAKKVSRKIEYDTDRKGRIVGLVR